MIFITVEIASIPDIGIKPGTERAVGGDYRINTINIHGIIVLVIDQFISFIVKTFAVATIGLR